MSDKTPHIPPHIITTPKHIDTARKVLEKMGDANSDRNVVALVAGLIAAKENAEDIAHVRLDTIDGLHKTISELQADAERLSGNKTYCVYQGEYGLEAIRDMTPKRFDEIYDILFASEPENAKAAKAEYFAHKPHLFELTHKRRAEFVKFADFAEGLQKHLAEEKRREREINRLLENEVQHLRGKIIRLRRWWAFWERS